MSANTKPAPAPLRLETLPRAAGVRLTVVGRVQIDFNAAEWRQHQADVAAMKLPAPKQETAHV